MKGPFGVHYASIAAFEVWDAVPVSEMILSATPGAWVGPAEVEVPAPLSRLPHFVLTERWPDLL